MLQRFNENVILHQAKSFMFSHVQTTYRTFVNESLNFSFEDVSAPNSRTQTRSENQIPDGLPRDLQGLRFAVETFPVLFYFYFCYASSRVSSLESKWWI